MASRAPIAAARAGPVWPGRLVVDANARKSVFKGVEITTSGIGIFGVAPVADPAGQHVGTVETAFEFGPLLDELKKDYGFELALFIDEKMLRSTATSLQGDVLNERKRVGKFMKFHSTHGDLTRSLVADGDIGSGDDARYVRDAAGLSYGVVLKPVFNHARQQIGVIAAAQDFTAMRSAGSRAVLWQLLLGVVSVVVLSGLILVTIRGLLLQPLAQVSDRLSGLAAGSDDGPVDPAAQPCEEVSALARSYNALRDGPARPTSTAPAAVAA